MPSSERNENARKEITAGKSKIPTPKPLEKVEKSQQLLTKRTWLRENIRKQMAQSKPGTQLRENIMVQSKPDTQLRENMRKQMALSKPDTQLHENIRKPSKPDAPLCEKQIVEDDCSDTDSVSSIEDGTRADDSEDPCGRLEVVSTGYEEGSDTGHSDSEMSELAEEIVVKVVKDESFPCGVEEVKSQKENIKPSNSHYAVQANTRCALI